MDWQLPDISKMITNNIFPSSLRAYAVRIGILSIGSSRLFPYCVALFPWIRNGLYINSKIHALVYINLCFHFGSGCLYSLKNCYTCFYVVFPVFHGSFDWGLKVCILIHFSSFKLDLKRVYTTKKTAMNRRCVTCFREVAIHIITVSRRLHSSNQSAFMVKKYRKCWFES